jgi:prepilin-type N-terminal cleavage/methylation domain-containing protein
VNKHKRQFISSLFNDVSHSKGFTIVELLIVIVVIAILATITIITYTGILNRVRVGVVSSNLESASKLLAIDNATNGTYPASLSAANSGNGLPSNPGTTYTYNYTSSNNSFCLSEIDGGVSYMISNSNSVPVLGMCLSSVNGGVVTTIAGSSLGYVDAASTAARFSYPDGIAIDSSGNLFVADRGNNVIRRITIGGVVSTFAGSGAQGSLDGTGIGAQFYYPESLVLDNSSNLYVTDRANNLIRKITSSGVVSTFAGSGVPGSANGNGTAAQFNAPYGIAIDASGNLYVADSANNQIRKITSSGTVTTLAGSTTAGNTDATGTFAQFSTPYGVAVDNTNNVFVADYNNNTIRKITQAGVVTTLAGDGTTGYIDATGIASEFRHPFGITIDSANNMYVTDRSNYKIREVTPGGVVTTIAGSSLGSIDGTGIGAQFYYPQGITVDSNGVIYVVDQGGHRIRKVQ